MIVSFADEETEDIFHGKKSKKALKRLNFSLWRIAQRKLHMVKAASRLEDLRIPPANRLEMLSGDCKGMYSIRINDQWRIIFNWLGSDADQVCIIDYHR